MKKIFFTLVLISASLSFVYWILSALTDGFQLRPDPIDQGWNNWFRICLAIISVVIAGLSLVVLQDKRESGDNIVK
jgi:uncharacterized membrane protein